jgi:hypothetical protein
MSMSAGLFAPTCPECSGELEIDHNGIGICAGCNRGYLNRFGYLIPIDHHRVPFEARPDSATFAPGLVERGGA